MGSVFDDHDGLGLAGLVRAGQVSPTELLDEAIERVDALDSALGVLADRYHEFARHQLAEGLPDGPFTGVPFLRKDCGCEVAGLTATEGIRLFTGRLAKATSVLAERFLAAGIVLFGATAVPPMSVAVDTDRSRTGPCGNPWDPTRTPGGSSAGAAAVVASGALPIAHGNDGGGSLRIPAAWSGAFTMKPSRGRVPNGPVYTEGWLGFAVEGVITRSVRDSAAMLDAIAGRELGSRYVAPPPDQPYLDRLTLPCPPLRVAVVERRHDGAAFDPAYLDATHRTAALLESLGHHVEIAQPSFDVEAVSQVLYDTVAVDLLAFFDAVGAERGQPVADEELETLLVTFRRRGTDVTGIDYALANTVSMETAHAWDAFMQAHDVVVSPTVAEGPPPLGEVYRHEDDLEALRHHQDRYINLTMVQNITGQPAMSVPLWHGADGLPIGMMFVGRYGDESTLFSLAAQLEAAAPWAERRPPLQAPPAA